jgi:CO/xanthine dehydrogenase FAD-binding subunit
MSITHEFDYAKPSTLDEAIRILSERGEGARVLAGGTDLVAWIRDDLVRPSVLVDLKGIRGLDAIRCEGDTFTIGALVTVSDLIASETVRNETPLIWEMARLFASVGIRNRATVVGNICSAVPSCDCGPVLLVYEARVHLQGPAGPRTIPIADWFTGPKATAIGRAEIVTAVSFERAPQPHGGCYVRLGRYHGEDLAQAAVAVLALAGDRYRIAFGAVAPTPVRARRLEAVLNGKRIDGPSLAAASALVSEETAPITDVRASEEYRAHMLPIMVERGLRTAVARRDGTGPPYGAFRL